MMNQTRQRLFFLCAHRSVREVIAASVLAALAQEWDIWIAPGHFDDQGMNFAGHVLGEIRIPLLAPLQTTEPTVEHSWTEGIVICSGVTDQ